MFQAWRIQLREVQAAVAGGQLDRAAEMLDQHGLGRYRPGAELSQELAKEFVTRAKRRVANEELDQAWSDLRQAARLGPQGDEWHRVRSAVIEAVLQESEQAVAAGLIDRPPARLSRLGLAGLSDPRLNLASAAWQHLQIARGDAHRGVFDQAAEHARAALQAEPSWKAVGRLIKDYEENAHRLRALEGQLHAALLACDATAILNAAGQILALAPEHGRARQARKDAWQLAGGDRRAVTSILPKVRGNTPPQPRGDTSAVSPHAAARGDGRSLPKRQLLWIDGVGGYLFCSSDEHLIGAPSGGPSVSIPIVGDISRRAAAIHRRESDFLLQPIGDVRLNGHRLTRAQLLRDGDLIQLGHQVQLRVAKPHPLSGTLRLDLVSRHRTEPSCDGVILMADTCVLSAASNAHIPCPQWSHELVVFRRDDQLLLRSSVPLSADGQAVGERTIVPAEGRLEGESFALTFEALGPSRPAMIG
jgi:tetratricopeptide (TPR) repeat protein